jgi:hypothetical protein
MLEIINWNVENFVNINKIIKNNEVISKLKNADLILIQEWKEKEGLLLLKVLNIADFIFLFVTTGSCCIIYNSRKFMLHKFVEIQLQFNIDRTLVEKTYLSLKEHRTSLLASFKPLVKMDIDILHCVCFHLGAFDPKEHKFLHSNQLNYIFKKLLREIKANVKNGVIIAGDTNYRTPDNDLLDKLVNKKLIKQIPGDFKDICHNAECLNFNTQSFRFLHEKNVAKQLLRKIASINIDECNNNPDSFICKHNKIILDNRLDFIATNMIVKQNKTHIKPYKFLSDHFMISTAIEPTIKSIRNKTLRNKTLRNKTFKNKTFK